MVCSRQAPAVQPDPNPIPAGVGTTTTTTTTATATSAAPFYCAGSLRGDVTALRVAPGYPCGPGHSCRDSQGQFWCKSATPVNPTLLGNGVCVASPNYPS